MVRLTREGLNTIINETVDIHDGGVSGVLVGACIEFAPDDTPRAVEEPGTAATAARDGGCGCSRPSMASSQTSQSRSTRGWSSACIRGRGAGATLIRSGGKSPSMRLDLPPSVQWPNSVQPNDRRQSVRSFSCPSHRAPRYPNTTVINRRVAPFTFGQRTSSTEVWFRTAPTEQIPGKFTTTRGWTDPFKIMANEDPDHRSIASILAQNGVEPLYSGASIVLQNGQIATEGLRGAGDAFMQGTVLPQDLPEQIIRDVKRLHAAADELGPVRLEWVHDAERAWVVQLHRGITVSSVDVLVPGAASHWAHSKSRRGSRTYENC